MTSDEIMDEIYSVILQFNPVKFISLNQYKIAKNTA